MSNEPIMREVLTKAVCGKGQLAQQNVIEIVVPGTQEIQVLGNHITAPKLKSAVPISSSTKKKMVKVEGQYDIHVWYATGQDTYSVKKTVNYTETIPITTFGDEDFSDARAYAEITSRPKCKKIYVSQEGTSQKIKLDIEQGLAAEIMGMTKLFVKSAPFDPCEAEVVCGQELVAPKAPHLGMLVPEFYPDQLEDLCEDDFEK